MVDALVEWAEFVYPVEAGHRDGNMLAAAVLPCRAL